MKTSLIVHLIADYGVGDPAFSEVMQKITLLGGDVRIFPTSVPAFSTLATGYWTAQFALVNPIPGMVIYTNTAPRKDKKEVRVQNEGEGLVYAKLTNGSVIVGVNAGYCFSFIKPYIDQLRKVNVANKGSQFRSRDFYPEAVVGIGKGDVSFLGEKLDSSFIPDVLANRIAWIDGYGNIKTTTRSSTVHFTPGQPVLVTLNGIKRTAFYTGGTFSVREGELAFAPGSTGGDDKFMELFLRGLNASKEFGKPSVEMEFTVEKE